MQVKKNCPLLYDELMDMFDDLEKLKETDVDEFKKVSGKTYSEHKTSEKNRERYEYRKVQYYDGKQFPKSQPENEKGVFCAFYVRPPKIHVLTSGTEERACSP